jgi:hypothetical protein
VVLLAVLVVSSGPNEGDQVRRVHSAPACLSGLDPLERHREPGPLVNLLLKRTVAKVDSMGFVVRRWIQCSAG